MSVCVCVKESDKTCFQVLHFVWISAKIEWVLSKTMFHPSPKFHGNPLLD